MSSADAAENGLAWNDPVLIEGIRRPSPRGAHRNGLNESSCTQPLAKTPPGVFGRVS